MTFDCDQFICDCVDLTVFRKRYRFNECNVYYICPQVETVGDKYMAVSGLPEACSTHAKSVARLALDIMDVSKELRNPNNHLIEVI